MINIINNTKNFIIYLEDIINQKYILEKFDYINNKSICFIEKKNVSKNIPKYNYKIVKLRNEIYYTKEVLEIFNSMFDNINISNIINVNNINKDE